MAMKENEMYKKKFDRLESQYLELKKDSKKRLNEMVKKLKD